MKKPAFARGYWKAWIAAGAMSMAGLSSVYALDLRQAYEAALVQDATLRAAAAATDAQRERLPQARAQLLPNVTLGLSRSHNDVTRTQSDLLGRPQQTQESYMSFNQTLTLRQPLLRKSLWYGLEQAGFLVQEAEARLEREQQNLVVRVVGAYFEGLLAQDQLELVRVQRQNTEVQLQAAQRAFAAGSGTRTDVDEAQARLDLVLAQELEAMEQLEFTRRQMEVMVNQPVTHFTPLQGIRMELELPTPETLEEWLAIAEANSPEIKMMQAQREAARLDIDRAQSGHLPTLDLVAQVVRSGSETVTQPNSRFNNYVFGLQFNLPLYAGGGVNSSVRQATAELVRADAALDAALRDLGMRVHQEFRGVVEGKARILALEQAARSAEQLIYASRRSFEAGIRTRLDVLNAEQRKQEVLLDLARARYVFLISSVRLKALAGVDSAAALMAINDWLQPQ